MADDAPRLYALPPGADFAKAFVDGLRARHFDRPPEQFARITVFLNSARMLAAVRAALAAGPEGLLPRLRLVSDLGSDPWPGLPPSVRPLRRRLELAALVRGAATLEPGLASGAGLFDLADSLAGLMAEMHQEGVAPEALWAPDLTENHAAHWERSLEFIRIVARYFDAGSPPDPDARQRRVTEALVELWRTHPPTDPVIVAGSTGSRGATQLLMRAVAGLPDGAVVLPGFDHDMTDLAWNSLSAGRNPDEDHPQYRFRVLASTLGVSPAAIRPWTGVVPPDPGRNRLLSLALRPAPVTDQWMTEGAGLGALGPAVARLALIEAPDPRMEALALAVRLREAAEEGQRAALVTPDRTLARRVTAALDRWGIVPDDSAGRPLLQSPPGRFLRHVADLMGRRLTSVTLLTLLKHPLTATGSGDRGTHLRLTRDLELDLRRDGPPFPTPASLTAWADLHERSLRRPWVNWLCASLAPTESASQGPLPALVATHLSVAEALAAGPDGTVAESGLWQEEAGRLARGMMEELAAEAPNGPALRAADYTNLLGAQLSALNTRETAATHPLISIRGTLEARVGDADVVLLGGLNEVTWPSAPAPDPWLSRQMRARVGLLSPERQIGLSAHDFQQAAAAPTAILSRCLRDDEAATVPSRWLARITNLLDGLPAQGGAQALEDMRARGRALLDVAKRLEEPAMRVAPVRRPAPRPPVGVRPRRVSVTGVSRLIRDPYAIYASKILRLYPLDPLHGEADARVRGETLHKIVERFVRKRPADETVEAGAIRLIAISEAILADDVPWPAAQRLWRARMARLAHSFSETEARRALVGQPGILEEEGSIQLDNGLWTLTAKPDRIDLLSDGRAHIYDYKSGTLPSKKQQRSFDKQLLLEAGMVERGAFEDLGPRPVAGVTYIRLGGDGEEQETAADAALFAETWAGVLKLAERYADARTGYAARRALFDTKQKSDYDHLSRFGEWDLADPSEPEDVG